MAWVAIRLRPDPVRRSRIKGGEDGGGRKRLVDIRSVLGADHGHQLVVAKGVSTC